MVPSYDLLRQAILELKQVVLLYDGYEREVCHRPGLCCTSSLTNLAAARRQGCRPVVSGAAWTFGKSKALVCATGRGIRACGTRNHSRASTKSTFRFGLTGRPRTRNGHSRARVARRPGR